MWSVGPQSLPMLPISQVPKPPRIHTIAVAQTNRDNPASVMRNPSTNIGIVLAIRCCPVGVQHRGEDDPPQAVGLERPDAVGVQGMAGQLVDQLDEVEQRHKGEDGGPADHPARALFRPA